MFSFLLLLLSLLFIVPFCCVCVCIEQKSRAWFLFFLYILTFLTCLLAFCCSVPPNKKNNFEWNILLNEWNKYIYFDIFDLQILLADFVPIFCNPFYLLFCLRVYVCVCMCARSYENWLFWVAYALNFCSSVFIKKKIATAVFELVVNNWKQCDQCSSIHTHTQTLSLSLYIYIYIVYSCAHVHNNWNFDSQINHCQSSVYTQL